MVGRIMLSFGGILVIILGINADLGIATTTASELLETKISTPMLSPTEAPENIPTFEWTFSSLNNSLISGNKYPIKAIGDVKYLQGGLVFQESTQYLDFGAPDNSCLNDLSLCNKGLTMSFNIMLKNVQENAYLISNGGEMPLGSGITIVFRFSRMQFVFSTNDESWYGSIPTPMLNKFHEYHVSWSKEHGMKVYVDRKLQTSVSQSHQHGQIVKASSNHFYFGKPATTVDIHSTSVSCVVKTIMIWYGSIETVVAEGLLPNGFDDLKTTKAPAMETTGPMVLHHRTTKLYCPKECFTTIKPKPTTPKRTPRPTIKWTRPPKTTKRPKPTTTKRTPRPTNKWTRPPKTTTRPKPTTPKRTPKPTIKWTRPPKTTTRPKPNTPKRTPRPTIKWTRPPKTTTTTPKRTPKPKPTKPRPTIGIPDYHEKPDLSVDVTETGAAFFQCSLSPSTDIDVEYSVWFTVGGKRVPQTLVTGGNFEFRLIVGKVEADFWKEEVQCFVIAHFPHGSWCKPQKSNIIIPEITLVTTETIIVTEGERGKFIKLQTNVPPQVFCGKENNGDCQIHIETLIKQCDTGCPWDKTIPQIVIGWTGSSLKNSFCGTVVSEIDWERMIKIPVKATIDGIRDGDQTVKVSLQVKVVGKVSTIYKLNPYRVTVIARDVSNNAVCASLNDPHITTFDSLRYDVMIEGEFVLYKHRDYPIEVRIQYQKCSRWGGPSTCNCGVSIKCVDDVITLSGCEGVSYTYSGILKKGAPITVKMYQNGGEWTKGFRIRKIGCGQAYEVRLPTGTLVTVKTAYKPFVNVWVTASAATYKNGQGLCGDYDCDKKNDLRGRNGKLYKWSRNPNKFSETWRSTSTIFNGVQKSVQQQISKIYCSCIKGNKNYCAVGLDNYQHNKPSGIDVTELLIQQTKTLHQKNTAPQADSDFDEVFTPEHHRRRRAVNQVVSDPMSSDWPSTNVWNETAANEYCLFHLVHSDAAKKCQPILASNFTDDLVNCVRDIKYMDSTDWVRAALDGIIYHCIQEASRDVKHWTKDKNGLKVPPVNIINDVCLDNCGAHGHCERGNCICDNGYTGIECDVTPDTVPEIVPIPATGPCNQQASKCSVAIIIGNNFFNTTSLTCHIQPLMIIDKMVSIGGPYAVPAIFVSISQVVCPVKAESSRITVSNNGASQSVNKYLHVVYDINCYDCAINRTALSAVCTRWADSCIIDGKCVAFATKNPNDICQLCDPDRSQSAWSHVNTESCEKPTTTKTKVAPLTGVVAPQTAVIGLSIACGLLGLAIIIGGIIIKLRSSPKRTEGGSYALSAPRHFDAIPKINRHENTTKLSGTDNLTYGKVWE